MIEDSVDRSRSPTSYRFKRCQPRYGTRVKTEAKVPFNIQQGSHKTVEFYFPAFSHR